MEGTDFESSGSSRTVNSYTHIEVAIGEVAGDGGQMANVLRVFNDAVGVELTQRTGRNPAYTYLSLGCSKAAEQRMLQFARAQVESPSQTLAWRDRSSRRARATSNSNWFCAELVVRACRKAVSCRPTPTLVQLPHTRCTRCTANRPPPLPTPMCFVA